MLKISHSELNKEATKNEFKQQILRRNMDEKTEVNEFSISRNIELTYTLRALFSYHKQGWAVGLSWPKIAWLACRALEALAGTSDQAAAPTTNTRGKDARAYLQYPTSLSSL
jgi:hypothetical protein